jgi:hypothetical protein
MLTKPRGLAVILVAVALTFGVTSVAHADGGCETSQDPWCQSSGSGPGSGAAGGNAGTQGGHGCTWKGQTVPCQDPDFGVYVGNGCYWKAMSPPPDYPPPSGHDPKTTGAWGVQSCYIGPGSGVVTQVNRWLDQPPAGPTPQQLAAQALAKIHLLGARIGIAPRHAGSGAVGLPVWMWTAVTPNTWGPVSASASGGGITVTVTAKAQQIVWNMGDGHSRTCANPGTPYSAGYGNAESPTCGYIYSEPSRDRTGGRYPITAVTSWRAEWTGGGQNGVLTPTSHSQTSVQIGEIQVVTR